MAPCRGAPPAGRHVAPRTRPLLLSSIPTTCHALTEPTFIKRPTDQMGVYGGVVSFVCQATGDPKPQVNWSNKKVNSQGIETIEFDEGAGAVLRIQPLRAPRHEDSYECVALNSVGEITVTSKLSIIREDLLPNGFPSIDMGPQWKVVERTRTATMLCAASGIPDPEISWFKDFLPVEPAQTAAIRCGALQIERSEETDQGKYECVASNSQGVSLLLPCQSIRESLAVQKVLMLIQKKVVGRKEAEVWQVERWGHLCSACRSQLAPAEEGVIPFTLFKIPSCDGNPLEFLNNGLFAVFYLTVLLPTHIFASYYIIQYRAKSPDSKFETVDGITTTRYSIGGLYPNTEYEIRVSAFNTIGQGPPSNKVEARTGEQAPASPPRNVQAQIISQSTVIVRWEEPEEPNGQIKGYRVYYTMDPSEPVSQWQIHNVQDSMITTIQSLKPSETYTIRVLAFTSVGDGPFSDPVHVKVLPGVPGQPGKFRVGRVQDTSVELIWDPPLSREPIESYELIYKAVKYGTQEKKSFEPRSSYMVEGLRANTEYSFILAAISTKGIGAFTNEITQRTAQANVPRNFSVNLATKTSVLLTWDFPESSSPYRFTVEYNRQRLEVDARLRRAVIPNLLPDTSYDFKITSPEGNMGGLRHRIHAKTSPPIVINRPEIDHSRDTETTVTIILPSVELF
ncbi:receptor-type tyrosine-protein phosphatase S-like [Brachyhypopomus gauderio]|uniref:receptor-type tyrosine-protein phosphatase S-like n=1 Tax=Brachyhypopomus gauderio TaxID=698409 RepID=UPI0040412386